MDPARDPPATAQPAMPLASDARAADRRSPPAPPAGAPASGSPASGSPGAGSPGSGQEEEGGTLAATIGGIVVVAVLVVLGYWLISELDSAAKYEKCVAARHRNCDQINYRN